MRINVSQASIPNLASRLIASRVDYVDKNNDVNHMVIPLRGYKIGCYGISSGGTVCNKVRDKVPVLTEVCCPSLKELTV